MTIEPYEYMYLKKELNYLINSYISVNDIQTIGTLQTLTKEKLKEYFSEKYALVEPFAESSMDITMTRANLAKLMDQAKEIVQPFKEPSNKQIEKAFRKVKKMVVPAWETLDLREHTYLGWNDPGTQRKYILTYQNGQLKGNYGNLSTNIQKGFCAICHEEAGVAMFLSTTRTSADGTYTKKGNYICYDSLKCNQQLTQIEYLDGFLKTLQ